MTPNPTVENIEFLRAEAHQPSASELIYSLAGVAAALDLLTCQGADDRDLIGNLSSAGHALARLLVSRMGECPVRVDEATP